jgi:hypothetical protein
MRGKRIVVANLLKATAGGYIFKLFPDSLRSRDGLSNNIQLMNALGLLVV